MLKDHTRPVSVLCTTTLEMGIDIGDMKAIAQLGAPPSVTSLRQRLGRSGRRGGAALLRAYVAEPALTKDSRCRTPFTPRPIGGMNGVSRRVTEHPIPDLR